MNRIVTSTAVAIFLFAGAQVARASTFVLHNYDSGFAWSNGLITTGVVLGTSTFTMYGDETHTEGGFDSGDAAYSAADTYWGTKGYGYKAAADGVSSY